MVIVNIPTPQDFDEAGFNFLNLAWDIALKLEESVRDASLEEWDEFGAVTDAYWSASAPQLANAIALIGQGMELLLKSRIAAVSPYLLVVQEVRQWPSGSHSRDVDFSEFRTVDAVDLIRLSNSVTESKLPDGFPEHFEQVRKLRNMVIHGLPKVGRFTTDWLRWWILKSCRMLSPDRTWVSIRKDHLFGSPDTIVFGSDYLQAWLALDVSYLACRLSRAGHEAFLGIPRTAIRALCPDCTRELLDSDKDATTAYIARQKGGYLLTCVVCDQEERVAPRGCRCGDGYWSREWERCVRCGRLDPTEELEPDDRLRQLWGSTTPLLDQLGAATT